MPFPERGGWSRHPGGGGEGAGSGGVRCSAQQRRQKQGFALKVAAVICQGAALPLAFHRSRVVLGVRHEIRTPGAHVCRWGCREGAGRDARDAEGASGFGTSDTTGLCRTDGLCVSVGGWTLWVGLVCSVGPLKVERLPCTGVGKYL